jgi:hypothetical protein
MYPTHQNINKLKSLNLYRDYLNGYDQNVGRNMDDQGNFNKVSDGNKEQVI